MEGYMLLISKYINSLYNELYYKEIFPEKTSVFPAPLGLVPEALR
jgi:hypothetical protein